VIAKELGSMGTGWSYGNRTLRDTPLLLISTRADHRRADIFLKRKPQLLLFAAFYSFAFSQVLPHSSKTTFALLCILSSVIRNGAGKVLNPFHQLPSTPSSTFDSI
jgi:hypothetical protein